MAAPPKFERTVSQVRVGGRRIELSNLEKVFYPATGFTKGQVIDYYARIAPAMVPHLKGRPLNLKRYPHGAEGMFFFQKEAPANTPPWLTTKEIWSDTNRGDIRFTTASDTASLVWLANLANLEFHSLLCRDDPDRPTMMVFDLDPGEGVGLLEAGAISLLLKDSLQDLGLKSFVKVSGGKGVQPYVPLNTPTDYETTRSFSLAVATELQKRLPNAVVTNMRKELRKGKVLIDYSQNSRHKSTVSVYSLRARPEPTVSAPLEWTEMEAAVAARDAELLRFTPEEVLQRFERDGDPFSPVLRLKQHIDAPRKTAPRKPSRRPAAAPAKGVAPARRVTTKAAGNSKNAAAVRTAWARKRKGSSPSAARKSR